MTDKKQVFEQLFDGNIPSRVPININVGFEACVSYLNADLRQLQWNMQEFEPVCEKFCKILYSDVVPVMPSVRLPAMYHFLGSQSFIPAENGYMQHPEVVGMQDDEYDELIEDPYACIMRKVLPRQFKSLGGDDPVMSAIALYQAMTANAQDMNAFMGILGKMNQKYGYFTAPPNSSRSTEAPFDYLADQLRSFSGISKDIRRKRDKIPAACEALYEFAFRRGLPGNISNYGQSFLPLHMPPFMREKDFADLWWPTFIRLIEHYASMGLHAKLFCEQDWTRYADYLAELPADTILWFEYGDAKLLKEKLGEKHILTGFYPLTAVKNKSEKECIDLAKEYIDILAPGGKYIFGFDKIPVSAGDVNMKTLCKLSEFIRDYAVYENAGQKNKISLDPSAYQTPEYRKIESAYFPSFDAYSQKYPTLPQCARAKYDGLNETLYQFLLGLIY